MLKTVFWLALAWWLVVAGYQLGKPLPSGVNIAGPVRSVPAASVAFFADTTFVDAAGQRHTEQRIFNEIFAMVDRAQEFIVVDMFLFNDFQGETPETTRPLARELTARLLAKRQQRPDIHIVVVSDPINTVYGGVVSPQFTALQEAGITVVQTNLRPLRDSNPLFSSLWRTYVQWLGNSPTGGGLHHPFAADGSAVTVRSYAALLNFKANHRKLIVADETTAEGQKVVTLVTSANPHEGSSAHGNVAVQVKDQLWFDVVQSEQAVLNFSGGFALYPPPAVQDRDGTVAVQLLTERAIRDAALKIIDRAQSGDQITMAMFYLSDRRVIRAVLLAADRGATVRLILDPNKDAFGRTKNGVPNRPVAHELVKESEGKIAIRWCATHGEQCHSKMLLVQQGGQHSLLVGSANFTRRNIGNYNLETDVLVQSNEVIPAIAAAYAYLDTVWNNAGGRIFTTDYATYADASVGRSILYRLQERLGVSSF